MTKINFEALNQNLSYQEASLDIMYMLKLLDVDAYNRARQAIDTIRRLNNLLAQQNGAKFETVKY